ncbi:protealysin inhibitor emfourin [Rathayibacter sp. YIM 133350]|uniref:protealysin inhibitor emfourin n=1 Tax=Rathayibacter sp. YIM 133350 TaxID=3131992 RepID=UPI00307F525C
MRVIVSRSGGFAGMRMTWQVVIDDQPDAPDWRLLVSELPWDEVPAAPATPDRFVYRIRYEEPQAHPPTREATLAEQQVQGPWRTLVDRVREAGQRPSAAAAAAL